MKTKALIGVDIGTTNIKAVAFTPNGTELVKASTPTLTHYPHPGWAYFNPNEIWDAICQVLRKVTATLPDHVEPAAIAFASMAEAAVPLNASGQPVFESIAWFDNRTEPQTQWWAEAIGEEKTAQITGLPVKPVFGILKLMWIRDNHPDTFAQITRWLNMADYGVFQLCGAAATDYSLASRMLVLDPMQKQWSGTLLDATNISADLLGELVPSSTVLGHVHASAADATGLPQGLPVCSGGHDHVCGSFALGLTQTGDVLDSMGTAEGIVLMIDKPRLGTHIAQLGIAQGVHVVPDRIYAMSGLSFSGGSVDWVRQLLLSESELEPAEAFAQMIALAEAVPAGSDGVFFLPHLRPASPSAVDETARGAFAGLTSDVTTGHMVRAVLEGLAYEYQRVVNRLLNAFDVTDYQQIATGGGTRNPLWMSIKADLSGSTISVPQVNEAVCLGAAALAGVGAGVYASFEDAGQQIQYTTQTIPSDPVRHQFYRTRYEFVYGQLYDSLKVVNQAISQL